MTETIGAVTLTENESHVQATCATCEASCQFWGFHAWQHLDGGRLARAREWANHHVFYCHPS